MGVWIETSLIAETPKTSFVTPFVGVWIETHIVCTNIGALTVTPFVGVWIETAKIDGDTFEMLESHPSWVCGLKLVSSARVKYSLLSHPSWVCGLKL